MSDDLVKRLRNWTTDWDGSKMVPGEPPKDGLHCDIIDEAADRIVALEAERDALREAVGKAEAALADIAEGEPDPDIVAENVWCKDRATTELPGIRAALAAYRRAAGEGEKHG